MFLVELTYKKSLDEVERYLEKHSAFLDTKYAEGLLVFSGRKNPRNGGIILVNTEDRHTVDQLIAEDPFNKAGICDYRITEFIPTKSDHRFKCFIK